MSKLDPRLENLKRRERLRSTPSARRTRPIPDRVNITVKFTGDIDDLKRLGFKPSTVLGHPTDPSIIATGSIDTAQLDALKAIDHVTKIEGSRVFHAELNKSVPEINAGPGHPPASDFTGEGVVVGIIDTGIDYRHNAFRHPDGNTRILAIWDQTLDADEFGGAPPAGFDGGIEYDIDTINEALEAFDTTGAGVELDIVPSQDKDGHGTKVAGIAAGDGSQAGNCHGEFTFVGVAPDAELIVVKRDFDSASIGESQNMVDALRYIFEHPKVAGRPVVINISLGDNQGAHDGTTLTEQAIDRFLLLPRRAVVKSAGNDSDEKHHARGKVKTTEPFLLEFKVQGKDKHDRFLELWYPGSATLRAQLQIPLVPAATTADVTPGNDDVIEVGTDAESVTVILESSDVDPDNGDRKISVQLVAPEDGGRLPSGTYTLVLTNTTSNPVDFDAWLDRGEKSPTFVNHFTSKSTVSIPGTSESIITVAAYTSDSNAKGKVKTGSGRGPLRLRSLQPNPLPLKPEIAAPGGAVTSARTNKEDSGCSECCQTFYKDLGGTSAAAPHVTGAIALMFEKKPDLTIAQIRRALFESASPPAGTPDEPLPNTEWGHGRLNVAAALQKMDQLFPVNPGNPGNPGNPVNPGGPSGPGPRNAPPLLADGPLRHRQRRSMTLSETPAFTALRQQAMKTPAGQIYAALVSRYFSEIRGLIRSQRRVGAAWKRCGGPQLVGELARRVFDADRPFPVSMGSVPLGDGLRHFFRVLGRYASADLRRDIDRYGSLMLAIEGQSLNDILTARPVAPTQAGAA